MRVIERSIYRGPHLYSARPMIRIQLDLGALEAFPSDAIEGFNARLLALLPGLSNHHCSLGRPGGFIERLQDGTWLGHVVEHVAIELQTRAGSAVNRGKTRSVRGKPGVYNVLYAYRQEQLGLAAGRVAIELVQTLAGAGDEPAEGLDLLFAPLAGDDLDPTRQAILSDLRRKEGLGPSTQSLVDEADRRGIPWARLDEHSLIRFGHGRGLKLMRASISGATSHIAVETAGNKALTKALLEQAGVPVPKGGVIRSAAQAQAFAERIAGPVVIKPLNGNHGRGVSLGVTGPAELAAAFTKAAALSRQVIIEQQISGHDYRVLVVGGKLAAVAERVPARVEGDGRRDLARLIEDLNADPRRGRGHENVLTKVALDHELARSLERQGLSLTDVPAPGRSVYLRQTANLSTGGQAIDRTDEIHPLNRAMAERAAAVIGLDIAGLDIIAPDIARPIADTGGAIIEVNAAPGLRMHLQPSHGRARRVARDVLAYLYPNARQARIPITAVTGTNGKSTTVRMIGHILAATGRSVGMTTTSGVYAGGQLIRACDASGPKSARQVLADPTVDAAVLETARGGILREGLGFDRADVGVVLNISEDHLGLKGVETLADLAAVKSVVVEQVRRRGASVLNADDVWTLRMARHARGRLIYFTLRGGAELSPFLQAHLATGGCAAVLEYSARGGRLILLDGDLRLPLIEAADIPATLGGAARFNVQNALAAAAAAYGQGVAPEHIARALASFSGSFEQNPGRLNLTKAPGFTTIVDYAHNPAALRALGEVIAALRPSHARAIGVVSTPGDRRDEDIRQMGAIAAGLFDTIIFRERPDGRGRAPGGVLALLTEGALEAGFPEHRMQRLLSERQAVDQALTTARADDLVVLMPTEVEAVWGQVQAFARKRRPARPSANGEAHERI
jgi:cyanophycin synthetase